MLHWGGDPGGIDSLCKDLAECPRPYLLLLLSHLWLGFGSLYLGDLVKKRNEFFILSHAPWQFFLIFHCGSRKGSPFPLPFCMFFVFVCFAILPTEAFFILGHRVNERLSEGLQRAARLGNFRLDEASGASDASPDRPTLTPRDSRRRNLRNAYFHYEEDNPLELRFLGLKMSLCLG